jgi:hypothetical protein
VGSSGHRLARPLQLPLEITGEKEAAHLGRQNRKAPTVVQRSGPFYAAQALRCGDRDTSVSNDTYNLVKVELSCGELEKILFKQRQFYSTGGCRFAPSHDEQALHF